MVASRPSDPLAHSTLAPCARRDGLDVLLHPLTDNSVADHSSYAMWRGSPVPLKLDTLRGNYRPELLPSA